mmetsp:Transcript_1497/g.2970  ORF Transcript_1497/g.2970 Transcript_1497/m.2970 type:complete len:499 (+) Transcript_1497:68-1564(+)
MADAASAERTSKREEAADSLPAAVKRQNLRWKINMAKAKAGLYSSMAVPKKVSQKMKGRLKKMGEDKLPEIRKQAHEHLNALQAQLAQRQRHHRVKQVQQAVKKAKAFVLRKVVRKCKEAAASSSSSTVSQLELRLQALKTLSVTAAAHKALLKYGLIDSEGGEPAPAAWEEMVSAHPSVCALVEAQLLQHPQVKAQLEKLADDTPLARDPSAAPAAAVLSTTTARKADDKPAAKALSKTVSSDSGVKEAAINGDRRSAMKDRRNVVYGESATSAADFEESSVSRAQGNYGGIGLKTIVKKSISRGAEAPRKRLRKRDFERGLPGDAVADDIVETVPSSRFVDSLAADDDDGGRTFTLGGAADLDTDAPKKIAKRNNIISRSGNRMGQRQRQALAQRDSEGLHGRGGGRDNGRAAGRGGGRGGGRGTAPARQRRPASGAYGSKYSGGSKGAVKGGVQKARAGGSSTAAEKEVLHPSWEAKRSSVAAIQEFQGKRITFD